jgi:hypothetical protein
MGLKAPRGFGWFTNPKRAAYNRIYNRTTVKADPLIGLGIGLLIALAVWIFSAIAGLFQNSTATSGAKGVTPLCRAATPRWCLGQVNEVDSTVVLAFHVAAAHEISSAKLQFRSQKPIMDTSSSNAHMSLLDLCSPLKAILDWYNGRRILRVRVHRAFFQGLQTKFYFVNVTNLSKTRELEITHVWFDTDPRIVVMQPQRPLPKRLKPDETWETWLPVHVISKHTAPDVYELARVRLSNGTVVRSKENKNVPPAGTVPGGKSNP